MFQGSGGTIELIDPITKDAKHPVLLHYAGAGAGLAAGIHNIPRYGKIFDPRNRTSNGSTQIAPRDFHNDGVIIVMNGCPGPDLTLDDFKGLCCFADLGVGIFYGYSGTALAMNINPSVIANMSRAPSLAPEIFWATANPRAMLLMAGFNIGVQVYGGVSASGGIVW
ncbi:hypothetical protein ACSBM8_06665 [Sphingomonas sp. ASY06-1R]|uniref:hypothetical protein n=1 Tax=Sphingomonas sp. ASY06-1R TaxID=3445771 RepID=UPI003FA2256E